MLPNYGIPAEVNAYLYTIKYSSAVVNAGDAQSRDKFKQFPNHSSILLGDPNNLHFVMAASILRAEMFGITILDWAVQPKALAEAIDRVMVLKLQP